MGGAERRRAGDDAVPRQSRLPSRRPRQVRTGPFILANVLLLGPFIVQGPLTPRQSRLPSHRPHQIRTGPFILSNVLPFGPFIVQGPFTAYTVRAWCTRQSVHWVLMDSDAYPTRCDGF